MAFSLTDQEDEDLFAAYKNTRNTYREIVGRNLYPLIMYTISTKDALDTLLTQYGASEALSAEKELATYHVDLWTDIATDIASLDTALDAVVTLLYSIETDLPGVLGIEVPA